MKSLSGNLELMHELNTKQILRVIRESGQISRTEIVERTNLTAATVSRIVNKLIKHQLVTETGYGESSGGRKPVLLELIPDSVLTVGIDLEIDEIKGRLVNLNGRVLQRTELKITQQKDKESILNKLKKIISVLLAGENFTRRITGIGIGMHGLVDYQRGVSVFPPAFDWEELPVAEIIREEYGLPVIIDNNVRALTLAEKWFGSGRRFNNFICLKVGTGIGSGIFADGRIYRGAGNSAGEIGHIIVDEDGPRCSCGNYGCLEAMASNPATVKRCLKALKQGAASRIEDLINGKLDELKLQHIITAAREGDTLSRQILQESGRYLGIAVASFINILNPEAVIISGDVVKGDDIILESLRSSVNKR
ncbi:MAG TPA: ROK family transcriptional regulator, partial [Halanaerobiales bacterium]|nr:ROK family transcriptional regulator [Halanaerobiales bacterium]